MAHVRPQLSEHGRGRSTQTLGYLPNRVASLNPREDLLSLAEGQVPAARRLGDVGWRHPASLNEPTLSGPNWDAGCDRRLGPDGAGPDQLPESSSLLTFRQPHATPPYRVGVATTP